VRRGESEAEGELGRLSNDALMRTLGGACGKRRRELGMAATLSDTRRP
jgi:hypothetical protein